jgi:hypothetical protein
MKSLLRHPKVFAMLVVGMLYGGIGLVQSAEPDIQVQKIPRNPAKPGISQVAIAVYQLPNKLIDQQTSPDKRYVAQVMYAEPGPVYYLAILDQHTSRRIYIDEQLITGNEYHFNDIKVRWKDINTVLVEAQNVAGTKKVLLEYNRKTSLFKRSEQVVPVEPVDVPASSLTPESITSVKLDTLDERMLLHKQVSIGVTYDALKQMLPDLGRQKNDGGQHLTDALLEIDVLGYPARVEFNFEDEVLYNFIYWMPRMKPEEAKVAYKKLQDYYSDLFGAYQEEFVQEEPDYGVRSSTWKSGKEVIRVVNNISYDNVTIAWSIEYK